MWDALRLDVRHSFRSLRRAPTFSLIVIVTLTLAVGATGAVGSLLNALVLRTLAVPSPEQLVDVSAHEPRANVDGFFYADTFNAYRASQRSFAQMSMYFGGGILRIETRSGVFENAVTEAVSPSYFAMVGARASAGRFFNESDDAVAVISEAYRRRIFGNAPGIGEVIKVNTVPATVIGVAANGFDGLQFDGTFDIIVPFAVLRPAGGGDLSTPFRSRHVVGRLARGVSIEAARAELLARWPSIQSATLPATLPEADREALLHQRLSVAPLASGFSGLRSQYGTTLWVLLALMGILLAVACANLAGLTLARSLTRRHQVAIRLALGGSARRVFWQLMVDGILLSTVALAGALPLAWGIIRAVTASLTFGRATPIFPTLTPDFWVLAATALLTLSIGLAIGVVPAWRSVAARVDDGLRRGRGTAGSLGRFGRGLLIAQVALSVTLLVWAGLFTATLARLRANDTSLQSQRIIFNRAFREPGDRQLLPPDYYRTLVTSLAHMPGADAAALSVYYPTYFGFKGPVPTDYHYMQADDVRPLEATVQTDFVSPGFFDLFRFHLLRGRDVSWADGPAKPAVALVSASLARALFPAGDVIGQHIRIAGPERREVEVIGVVADAPYVTLDDPRPLVVFRPIMQEVARAQFPMAYVRASGDLATVRDGYTRVVKSLGHRSLRGFITSSEWVDHALLQERFTAGLATFAAAITILLACIGVYGLLAYSVTARVREIGVRLALGAERKAVVWMIVRDGLAIALPGVLIGAPCAWAAARLVRAQLYGIAPGDPRTLVIAAAILSATVLAASLLPALRASRVAPVEALREE
ncbi:MAG TPA: ABC transporter permease [Vicinamibacterales bacterium]|jgi:predicted permease